jgi:hypothetical protein
MVIRKTPNVGFNIPEDISDMKDVDTYVNSVWDKVENIFGSAKEVSSVPDQDLVNYKAGDRIYVVPGSADPVGLYICLGVDTNWGTFWRPITPVWGPWRRPGPVLSPSTILVDPTNYNISDTDSPFQMRINNKGRVELRGCIRKNSGTWPDVSSTGYYATPFINLPEFLIPGSFRSSPQVNKPYSPQIRCAPYPVSSSPTIAQTANCIFDFNQRRFILRVNTDGAATITKVFFSGGTYNLGDMDL